MLRLAIDFNCFPISLPFFLIVCVCVCVFKLSFKCSCCVKNIADNDIGCARVCVRVCVCGIKNACWLLAKASVLTYSKWFVFGQTWQIWLSHYLWANFNILKSTLSLETNGLANKCDTQLENVRGGGGGGGGWLKAAINSGHGTSRFTCEICRCSTAAKCPKYVREWEREREREDLQFMHISAVARAEGGDKERERESCLDCMPRALCLASVSDWLTDWLTEWRVIYSTAGVNDGSQSVFGNGRLQTHAGETDKHILYI